MIIALRSSLSTLPAHEICFYPQAVHAGFFKKFSFLQTAKHGTSCINSFDTVICFTDPSVCPAVLWNIVSAERILHIKHQPGKNIYLEYSGALLRNHYASGTWHTLPEEPGENIILYPGSGSEKKNWPLENYLELAAGLIKKNKYPVFLCGCREMEMKNSYREKIIGFMNCRFPDLFPKTAIVESETLVQLYECIRSARLVVCADTGIMHLALWMHKNTLAVFGPTSPKEWAPADKNLCVINANPAFLPAQTVLEKMEKLLGV